MSSAKIYSDAEVAALLKPQNFSWADEMEDESSEEEYSSVEASDSDSQESDDECVLVTTDGPFIVDSFDFVPKRPLSPKPMGPNGAASSAAMDQDHAPSWLQQSMNEVDVQLLGRDGFQASEELPEQHDYQLDAETAEAAVAWEFCHRNDIIFDDCDQEQRPIHHFNWYGNPVREYSRTPAAHSLLYILSRPKTPAPSDENRVQSILNRAIQFVDPVIYDGDVAKLQRSGQDLVNAVTGQVFKFYSPHGCWHNDPRDREKDTIQDNGAMDVYTCPEWVVANGFYDHPLAPTREQMYENWQNLRDSSPRHANSSAWKVREKRSRQYITSSLRLATGADTDACDDMNQGRVYRIHGKFQWWEAAMSVEISANEALYLIPEEETESVDDMADSQSLSSSTDICQLTSSESFSSAESLESCLTMPKRPETPEPSFAMVTKLGEWVLSDQTDSFDAKQRDQCVNNMNSISKGIVYRVAKRCKVSARKPVSHKILRGQQSLYSIAETSFKNTGADGLECAKTASRPSQQVTDQHGMASKSQDGKNTSEDGQDHSADEDVPEVRPSLPTVIRNLSLFSVKIVDIALTTHQTHATSHTVSNPPAPNGPNSDANLNKRKNPSTRLKWSRSFPKWLHGQRVKARDRLLSENSGSSTSESEPDTGPSASQTSTQEMLTYFSFPEPVFNKDRKPAHKKWLSGKVWRSITHKLLDSSYASEEGDSNPPVPRIIAIRTMPQEQLPSPSTQAQQKPRKRSSIRKVVRNFILDGLGLMSGYYPGGMYI
ncbi:hypothetical protein VTN77DRAFT_2393 [Rasamsonia byssochlamydoides]|uniref:uncharacterized protein n=1 Tax=Rasamsonia byssochlamydoides TaxID=89139 RepID=UPI003744317E